MVLRSSQAACGDLLGWFVRSFPQGRDSVSSFAFYDDAASRVTLEQVRPLAASVGGMMIGLGLQTSPVDMYWSLLESLCFGAQFILDVYAGAGVKTDHVVLASGLAERAPVLMQMMADVLERDIHVPVLHKATAVGAAIHAAVASHVVPDFDTGADRFGARETTTFHPRAEASRIHRRRYERYLEVSREPAIVTAMQALNGYAAADEARIAIDAKTFLSTL